MCARVVRAQPSKVLNRGNGNVPPTIDGFCAGADLSWDLTTTRGESGNGLMKR